MKNKKIHIVFMDMDNLKNPFWGSGQARATREVGKRLALKHNVTVYSSKYPNYRDYREDGITYKHIGFISKNHLITNLMYLLCVPFKVRRIKADIIIEEFTAPTSVSFAPLFTKIPIIALPTMFNAIAFYKKYHIPFHWVEKLGMRFYKYMLPYSFVDSTKAKSLNPSIHYRIVPQGVDKMYFQIKQQKPEHILFLGRFDIQQKGIDLLIKAYAKVKKQIRYPLVIAGHGPDERRIQRMIEEYDLTAHVTVVGSAYGKKKHDLMSKALFVAFPSRHDEMCLWALEALAGGLPLIGFDLPESRWMNDQVSLKAKPFDINEYSKLLVKATNKELIIKMRVASRSFARKYTWEKVAAEFETFITDVIRRERKNSYA